MSAFTTIVGRLGELTESELSQLHSIVAIRLGIPVGGSKPSDSRGSRPNKSGKGKAKVAKAPGAGTRSSKGNPSRKSQWETHPAYREYKRLKKTVETQAKERNCSFAAVESPERESYNQALSQWLEAKSRFRDRSGPENQPAEASSAKGKEKATTVAPPEGIAPGGSSSGNAGRQSWADEANQDAMDVESSSDSEAEPEKDGDQPAAPSMAAGDGPKRGTRDARLPSRGTPPKKPSGVPQKK